MKAFLEEYGFSILAAIVVIVLIMMISPVGVSVRTALGGMVGKFDGSVQNGLSTMDARMFSDKFVYTDSTNPEDIEISGEQTKFIVDAYPGHFEDGSRYLWGITDIFYETETDEEKIVSASNMSLFEDFYYSHGERVTAYHDKYTFNGFTFDYSDDEGVIRAYANWKNPSDSLTSGDLIRYNNEEYIVYCELPRAQVSADGFTQIVNADSNEEAVCGARKVFDFNGRKYEYNRYPSEDAYTLLTKGGTVTSHNVPVREMYVEFEGHEVDYTICGSKIMLSPLFSFSPGTTLKLASISGPSTPPIDLIGGTCEESSFSLDRLVFKRTYEEDGYSEDYYEYKIEEGDTVVDFDNGGNPVNLIIDRIENGKVYFEGEEDGIDLDSIYPAATELRIRLSNLNCPYKDPSQCGGKIFE